MVMNQLKLMTLLLVAASLFVSCDDADEVNKTGNLSLSFDGLEALGDGYAYEGWLIVDGSPVSTGIFTVDASGTLSQSSFEIETDLLESASSFVLSIEPAPDNDPAPAATKLLVGDFASGSATLGTGIVGDFANTAGSFFLRTPTDESGDNNGNDENGVWFGIPGAPPTAGFALPELPEGWAYEGWVVGENGPLTTGTFTSFDAADDAAPYSGIAQSGPPVPGEDFFLNAPDGETFPLDIRGRTVVISVEPVPDDSPLPFVLKPLVGTAGNETAPETYSFGQNLGSLPTGVASF